MKVLIASILLLAISCQQEEKKSEPIPQLQKSATVAKETAAPSIEDLTKKKDEGCTTEEDIKKKLEEEIKAAKAPSLQGSDAGCDPNAPEEHQPTN